MHIFFYDPNVIYRAEFIIISFLDFSPSAAAGGGLFQLCFIVATSADVHVHVRVDVVSSGATALGMAMCHLHTQPQAVAIMTPPQLTWSPFSLLLLSPSLLTALSGCICICLGISHQVYVAYNFYLVRS